MSSNFYRAFEDKHRGSRELIKSRLRVYLPFIEPLKALHADCKAVDLGCGRGEWLELLKEIGVDAHGVDLDDGMLAACRELGLSVETGEAVSLLKSLPGESQAIVSGFHIVEHIPFVDLQILVQEALRVLKPTGLLILETPNPENIVVGTANFYLDPTHLHPIPPQLLAFLPDYYGFYRTKTLRLQEPPELASSKTPSLLDVFGGVSPDYAIVAQKNAKSEILTVFDHVFEKEYGLTLETLATHYDAQVEAKALQPAAELSGVRGDLIGVRADLEKLRVERDKLQAALDEIRAERDAIQTRLDEVWADREKIRGDRDGSRVDLNGVRIDLDKVRTDRERIRTQLDEVWADRDIIRAERDTIQTRLDEVWAHREQVLAELDQVYHSRSFRITAPLRAVFGAARSSRQRVIGLKNRLFSSLVPKFKESIKAIIRRFVNLIKRVFFSVAPGTYTRLARNEKRRRIYSRILHSGISMPVTLTPQINKTSLVVIESSFQQNLQRAVQEWQLGERVDD